MNWSRTQPELTDVSLSEEDAARGKYTRRQMLTYAASTVAVIAGVDAYAETAQIEITRHTVPMKHLERPMRVAQITDLHRSQFVPEHFVQRVVQQTNGLKPDLVLLTGDFVTRTSGYAESCMRQLAHLRSPLGLYAVLGNHDYWCDNGMGGPFITDALAEIGVETVINRSLKLRNGVRLVGVDDVRAGVPSFSMSLEDVKRGEPVLIMTHNPGAFKILCRYDHITVAGHTHGGQIYVPVVSDMFVRSPFVRGWYQYPELPGRMYVSRGLGTIHVPMRMASAPELSVFDFVPV